MFLKVVLMKKAAAKLQFGEADSASTPQVTSGSGFTWEAESDTGEPHEGRAGDLNRLCEDTQISEFQQPWL